ncbi:MAG: hypothetical protein IPL58_12800 [Betaproteobacteria bacterium]|uniref:Arc-like DNA binding domain-containing protein n=1 Tax=Candidatus Proximibacter danicus TaxID=2954365 RepID=A0A9D7K3N6_9PROT|nr:hypothetical protein [Candidatus Proximibacter danicus]
MVPKSNHGEFRHALHHAQEYSGNAAPAAAQAQERNHRSINGEMLAALDQYVSQQRPDKAQLLADIRTLRQKPPSTSPRKKIDRAKREGRP